MISRRVVVPAGVERLWRALTDPEEASRWLGGRVEWTPEAGADLRFRPSAGGELREGRVEEVVPHCYMRFVWWPAGGETQDASEVAYSLEPVVPGSGSEGSLDSQEGEATILTVEEARVPAASSAASAAAPADGSGSASTSASASASTSASASASPVSSSAQSPSAGAWSLEDEVLWHAFAQGQVALARRQVALARRQMALAQRQMAVALAR